MLYPESPLEQTQRHVTEGQGRIAQQEALIERLKQAVGGERAMLPDAQKFLVDMHEWQQLGEEHLLRELAKLAG